MKEVSKKTNKCWNEKRKIIIRNTQESCKELDENNQLKKGKAYDKKDQELPILFVDNYKKSKRWENEAKQDVKQRKTDEEIWNCSKKKIERRNL